jgi:putative redox protein
VTTIRTAELVRVDGHYDATTTSGVRARFGVPEDDGLSPMDTVLAALAACTAMDVHSIATKKRQPIDRYVIRVRGEQRDEHPRIYTRIELTHEVEGPGLDVAAIRRSIELSATRYCPVSAMLSAGATEIHHRYAIRATGAGAFEAEGEAAVTGPFQRPDPDASVASR